MILRFSQIKSQFWRRRAKGSHRHRGLETGMQSTTESEKLLQRNKKYIPGGVVSVNRAIEPEIAFARGEGSRIWDVDGNEYIDYHAAFGPHFLGHNDPYVTEAVTRVLREGNSLFGSGTTVLEGQLAELLCEHVPAVESVQLLNTGSHLSSNSTEPGGDRAGPYHKDAGGIQRVA